jgi:ubiquinone/menaquinone biosynthesis C-methylase UbiE
MKREIKKKYDRTASFYNRRYSEIQQLKYRIMIDFPVKGKVLDIGCGTGLLHDFLDTETYIGVDISREMLKRGKFSRKILADCELLPFKENIFDHVFSFTVLQNAPSYALISEAYRVLKPEGIFVLTILKKAYNEDIHTAFNNFDLIDTRHCGEDIGFIVQKA